MLKSLGGLDGVQEEFSPPNLAAYVLNANIEMVQHSNESFYPNLLESPATDQCDGAYTSCRNLEEKGTRWWSPTRCLTHMLSNVVVHQNGFL